MRAALLKAFGTDREVTDIETPVAGAGQVLVAVEASGVNPLDTKIRAGKAGHAKVEPPAVLGIDLAGVVRDVGPGVFTFAPGDLVYGMTGGVGDLQGSLAEYVAADARLIAHRPASLTPREAASLPLVSITAWEGLVDRANVRAGQKVLVHGGAGGIGNVAIQIALSRGAEVFATGSPGSFATIERLGATPIDYTSTTVEKYVAEHTGNDGFDVVLDTVGGATLDASFLAARVHTGHVVSALGWGTHSIAPLSFRGATYSGVFTLLPMLTGHGRAHHGAILAEISQLVDQGRLTPRLDRRHFTLDTVAEAYRLVEAGTNNGKVVIDIPVNG